MKIGKRTEHKFFNSKLYKLANDRVIGFNQCTDRFKVLSLAEKDKKGDMKATSSKNITNSIESKKINVVHYLTVIYE